jgi:REP element-mobilizing transposase RayT
MENRRIIRADWHDYNAGLYFITICTNNREQIFGHIDNAEMHLSTIGKIVNKTLSEANTHFADAEIITYVIMPNHVHLIIEIKAHPDYDTYRKNGCLKQPKHSDDECHDYHYNARLAVVVRSIKAACSMLTGAKLWQRGYYDRILRKKHEFELAQNYMELNVINWDKDHNHPNNIG